MSEELKPCPCGYRGLLTGKQNKEGFMVLMCPGCGRFVEALTLQGLFDGWNAEPEVKS